jgi:hypothetical protein
MLSRRVAVESHDEVVTYVMARTAFAAFCRLGHVEDAPVGYATDYATALEDEGAGSSADTVVRNL